MDCSYNPNAFPPSLEVSVGSRATRTMFMDEQVSREGMESLKRLGCREIYCGLKIPPLRFAPVGMTAIDGMTIEGDSGVLQINQFKL